MTATHVASPAKEPSRLYSYYVLALLTLVFVMNLADRQVIAIVAEPLKEEMKLADWQLGMLTGPATALLYAILALPMAYLSDRVNRVKFMALACGLWSVITALGGVAQNVWQLAATRLGVSIAEAGGSPSSLSILSDYFSAKQRAWAFAIWSSATSIGVFVGFALGGLANDHFGWRGAFIAAGIPGIFLGILVWFTVRNRVRGSADNLPPPPEGVGKTPIWRDMYELLRNPVLRWTIIASSFSNVCVFSIYAWGPSVALRNYDVTTTQVGASIGIGIALAGTAFSLMSGAVIDQLNRRNRSYPMYFIAGTQLAAAGLFILTMRSPTFAQFSLLLPLTFGMLMTFGPLDLSVVQSYAPPWRRSMSAALNSFALSLVGPGLAVPVIGAVSDHLMPTQGSDSLRNALILITPAALVIASLGFLMVSRAVRKERALEMAAPVAAQ